MELTSHLRGLEYEKLPLHVLTVRFSLTNRTVRFMYTRPFVLSRDFLSRVVYSSGIHWESSQAINAFQNVLCLFANYACRNVN